MKIERRKKNRREKLEVHAELARIVNPPARTRVCNEACDAVCPTCGSTGCACSCSSACPHISTVLTSDPAFPIEELIAPLAFELKRLGVFEPCWSCEGHKDRNGDLWKVPRVWFYCDSVVYIRILYSVLKDMDIEERLEVPWQVRVTFSDDDNLGTAFSLRPDSAEKPNVTLEQLQRDVRAITEDLYDRVMEKAGILLNAD
ncbi:MAG: hypothetical protein O3B76_07690 [Proteobacteria bacterium]|nr:hypothetical protein [Pseudomonadota bacterium]MDA1023327.1 hypothetical protein [Pseudomonadota bacterium]